MRRGREGANASGKTRIRGSEGERNAGARGERPEEPAVLSASPAHAAGRKREPIREGTVFSWSRAICAKSNRCRPAASYLNGDHRRAGGNGSAASPLPAAWWAGKGGGSHPHPPSEPEKGPSPTPCHRAAFKKTKETLVDDLAIPFETLTSFTFNSYTLERLPPVDS